MVLHAWSFIAISLAALLMGCTFCHVLEIPAKLKMEAPFWMTLRQRLYRTFGPVGGALAIAAILAAAVLAFLMRDDQRAFYMTLGAAISLAGAFFVVWLMFTNTVNVEVSKWKARDPEKLEAVGDAVGVLTRRPVRVAADRLRHAAAVRADPPSTSVGRCPIC